MSTSTITILIVVGIGAVIGALFLVGTTGNPVLLDEGAREHINEEGTTKQSPTSLPSTPNDTSPSTMEEPPPPPTQEPPPPPPTQEPPPPPTEPEPTPPPPSEPPPPPPAEPEIQEFTIEADDVGFYPDGNITVKQGVTVRITFIVRTENVYFQGLDFRSSEFDTPDVPPGEETTVEFVASETFMYSSYWPSSNTLKATATVTVSN